MPQNEEKESSKDLPSSRWQLTKIDEERGAIVIQKLPFQATLNITQIINGEGPFCLASLILEKKDKSAIASDSADAPIKITWNEAKIVPFGTIAIEIDESFEIVKTERTKNAQCFIRNRGGKSYQASKIEPEKNRGGYCFADAELEEDKLYGKLGIKDKNNIFAVNLLFNNKNATPMPLVYPSKLLKDDPEFPYKQHTFEINYDLTLGKESSKSKAKLEIEVAEFEFTTDAACEGKQLSKNLTMEYGNPKLANALHPRIFFVKYVTGKHPVAVRFFECVREAVEFINGKNLIFKLSPIEVATNFLCEGGFASLNDGVKGNSKPDTITFSGYESIGIDSFVSRWKKNEGCLRTCTSESLTKMIRGNKNIRSNINERKDTWETFDILNLKDAVYASAALYAHAKECFAKSLMKSNTVGVWTTDINDLPIHVQHYWSALFYNVGSERAESGFLAKHGLEHHDLIWDKEDNHNLYQQNAKYNANWRTATFRYLQRFCGSTEEQGI